MKDRFDLLVFDWDGTLFDSIGWIVECIQHAAHECQFDIPSDDAARAVIGLSLPQAMQTLYPGSSPEQAERLAVQYRAYYHRKPVTALGLFEGVEAMLVEFQARRYKLAVATGKARSGLDHALLETGMKDFFHATRCADETASKPDPLMMRQLMEVLEAPSERTLLIGDSLHDMRMARNAGVAGIGVGCGANHLVELAELHPLACIESTAELLNLLT
jgi:phosphoglycolate phosphatase